MAKVSQVNRNGMRAYKSKRDKSKRAALKAIVMDRTLPVEDRFNATLKLAQLPRNGAAVRVRLRCLPWLCPARPTCTRAKSLACPSTPRSKPCTGRTLPSSAPAARMRLPWAWPRFFLTA